MSKCRRGLAVVLTVVLAAVTVYAQEAPAGRWWHSPQVAQQLQLSGNEIRQLEQAFEASRLKMIRLKSQVEAEQFKLQTMVEKQNSDNAVIKAQHRALEQARSALADEQFAYFVEVRQILGPERFQKLISMTPEGRGKRK
jgi:Spy/CpxP family protein refolding chaperone